MKKFLVGLLLLVFGFVLWLQFPRVHNPDRVEAMRASAAKRFQAIQSEADNPERNGFLNPTFMPYWGRKGQEYQPGSPVEEQVKAWQTYSTEGSGELVDHSELQQDPEYQAALADFRKLVPDLTVSMRKPIFAPPDEAMELTTIVMNYMSVRASAQAMIGFAEAELEQGQAWSAADLTVTVVQFGRTLQNHTSLIGDMIGVAIQAIGVDGYVGLIRFDSQAVERADCSPNRKHIGQGPDGADHGIGNEWLSCYQ